MAGTISWRDAVKAAWATAAGGQPEKAIASILDTAASPPTDSQLAPLFHLAAVYGQQDVVIDFAEDYIDRKTPALSNVFTNVWVLEVLRRAGHFEKFINGCLTFSSKQIKELSFYTNLATALHDDDFLAAFEGDPRLTQLLSLAAEQCYVATPEARHELIFKNAFVFTSAPQSYHTLLPIHQALMKGLSDTLEPSKNLLLTRLILGVVSDITSDDLTRALSIATPKELFTLWTIGKSWMPNLIRVFHSEDNFDTAVEQLTPEAVLTFEKIHTCQPDTALRLTVDSWVDRIPERYGNINPTDMPVNVLDQLVIIHRTRRPDIYDWYIAHRIEAHLLTSLTVLNLTRSFPAPRLNMERKPRVAVCISGQLRGYTRSHASVKQHLLADVEPVIFVDTWSKIGRKAPIPAQAYRMFSGEFLKSYQALGNKIGFPAMQARYPALTTLEDASPIDEEAVSRFYGCPPEHVRVEDDMTDAFTGYTNPRKMYYKIRGAQDMLENSGVEVDAVLRIRPDKSVNGVTPAFDWHSLINTSHCNRVFHADLQNFSHSISGFVIGDQAGIATMDLMHIYAYAEEATIEAGGLGWKDWPDVPRPHANLSHALWINNIRVDTLPVRWGKLFDPELLSPKAVLSLVERDLAGRSMDKYDKQLLSAARTSV